MRKAPFPKPAPSPTNDTRTCDRRQVGGGETEELARSPVVAFLGFVRPLPMAIANTTMTARLSRNTTTFSRRRREASRASLIKSSVGSVDASVCDCSVEVTVMTCRLLRRSTRSCGPTHDEQYLGRKWRNCLLADPRQGMEVCVFRCSR